MSQPGLAPAELARTRALRSAGRSATAIYRMVGDVIASFDLRGATAVDVGCGTGALHGVLRPRFSRYIGVDLIRYPEYPAGLEFHQADLDGGRTGLADRCADLAVAVETIEHLENPRALVRELVRITRPGGAVVVTTPNQLSLLSKATLLLKNEFDAFREGSYPAHRTALLGVDLLRIAAETGLDRARLFYSGSGRIALTGRHFPRAIARRWPRALSDNVLLIGFRTETEPR